MTDYKTAPESKSEYKFPKASLVFALLSLAVWFYTTFVFHYFTVPGNFIDILELVSDVLVFVGLVVGICMYKIRGHIFTGIVLILYSISFGYYLIETGGISFAGGVSDAIYTASQMGVAVFFLIAGLYYVLNGKVIIKPVKQAFCILYIVCILAMSCILYTEYYDFIKESGTMLDEIALDFAKNIFLGSSVVLFNPLKNM